MQDVEMKDLGSNLMEIEIDVDPRRGIEFIFNCHCLEIKLDVRPAGRVRVWCVSNGAPWRSQMGCARSAMCRPWPQHGSDRRKSSPRW